MIKTFISLFILQDIRYIYGAKLSDTGCPEVQYSFVYQAQLSRHFSYCFICPQNPTSIIQINRLTPNDPYMGRTAPLTSKRCILYIYSTNTGTEYFKHALYSPFFCLQNAVCFIILTCLVPVLFTFYIQVVLN